MLFGLSYALLGLLVVLEGVLLREALRETLEIKRAYSGFERHVPSTGLPSGVPAPDFSAPLLGTGQLLRTTDLKGESTILLFVSPGEASLPGYQYLTTAIHALWHRMEGCIYLVCSGSEEACRQFTLYSHFHGFRKERVQIVVDEGANIARSFQIDSTPTGVELDGDLLVRRYGRPVIRAVAGGGDQQAEEEVTEEAEQSSRVIAHDPGFPGRLGPRPSVVEDDNPMRGEVVS